MLGAGLVPLTMRVLPLSALAAAALTGLLAGPAIAEGPSPAPDAATPSPAPDAAAPPAPVPEIAPPAPRDEAGRRELQERLFASEALSWTASGVTRNGVRIDSDSFYRLVGRTDLVDRHHRRHVLKGVLIGAGATSLGFGLAARAFDTVNFCIDSSNCPTRASGPVPTAMILAGGVTLLVGIVLPADPVSDREKNDLVYDYNRRLRAHIGLSGLLETIRRTTRVSAAAAPDGRSGMLLAGCAY